MNGPPSVRRRIMKKLGDGVARSGCEWEHRPVPPQRGAKGKPGAPEELEQNLKGWE